VQPSAPHFPSLTDVFSAQPLRPLTTPNMFNRGLAWFPLVICLLANVVLISESRAADRSDIDCSIERLSACNKNQAQMTDFSSLTKKEDLSQLCSGLNEGFRCIDEYTRQCLEPQQRSNFNKIYVGPSMVIQEICQDGPIQKKFLEYAPCLQTTRARHEACVKEYQRKLDVFTSEPNIDQQVDQEKFCSSFQEYLNCSKQLVKEVCGEETAEFSSLTLSRMTRPLNQLYCKNYPVLQKEGLLDDEAEKHNASPGNGISIATLILSVCLVLLILFKANYSSQKL